ncbi:MAG TPA: DNA-3-methyladenine glycosylase I [Ktedonobacteraceae bacterium]|nr:DNA-3-methyladenine glycosylase I [Ktedonobacteraceae bacterium]
MDDRKEIPGDGPENLLQRCSWAEGDPLLRAYHDKEWGVPVRDSRMLWEMLMLEGFQAGLSWLIILRRREAFREAFQGFNPEIVARFNDEDVARLVANPGIIRAQAKIQATINGAQAYLAMAEAGEDFSAFAWSFVHDVPIRSQDDNFLAQTPLSAEISKALKKRGFKFVGPVIVYAWMQAVGLVNDHVHTCFRRDRAGEICQPQ